LRRIIREELLRENNSNSLTIEVFPDEQHDISNPDPDEYRLYCDIKYNLNGEDGEAYHVFSGINTDYGILSRNLLDSILDEIGAEMDTQSFEEKLRSDPSNFKLLGIDQVQKIMDP